MADKNKLRSYTSGWVCKKCRKHGYGDLPGCKVCEFQDNIMIHIGEGYYHREPAAAPVRLIEV